MRDDTLSPRDWALTNDHVCRDCGRLHEVVPTCHSCDRQLELRRFWFDLGHEQGAIEQSRLHETLVEELRRRNADLAVHVGRRVAKYAQGPSHAELERRRNGGER